MDIWAASSKFGTYRLCKQRRFRRACASAQSRQNLRCSLIQAVSQKESSDRKPDPWPLWMAGHAQLKFVMTECSKTQIRLTLLISSIFCLSMSNDCIFSIRFHRNVSSYSTARKQILKNSNLELKSSINKLIREWISHKYWLSLYFLFREN